MSEPTATALTTSTTDHSTIKRGRGRPKGSTSRTSLEERPRRLGRPPGTGYLQKARVLGNVDAPRKSKRPVGRPRKQQVSSMPVVSVPLDGPLVFFFHFHLISTPINHSKIIPGTQQTTLGLQEVPATWEFLQHAQHTPVPHPQPFVRSRINTPTTLHAKNSSSDARSHSAQPTAAWPSSLTADQPPLPNSLTQTIILEEDPQRSVEIPDNDEDDEATGNGLGQEDGDPDDEDELNDELNVEVDVDDKGVAGKAQPSRRPLPSWLLEPFKARVAESSTQYRNAEGLPPLYALHQTFWFPQPSTIFLVTKGLTPQQIFNPLFFLWDPEALCPDGIPCPNCQKVLHRHQVISRPRRCVGIDQTFWIIGYRYRCRNCVHPKSKKSTVTFRSWDQRILAVLPPALAAEFPAQLSHRSGISTSLFSWMRSSFNYGMGSKQFADALRMQHVLRYDLTELQYLNHISSFALGGWLGQKFAAFPPFDDLSSQGPHLYTPCAALCRNFYDNFIDKHRAEINQHTAMLTANICAIDHSHKVSILSSQ